LTFDFENDWILTIKNERHPLLGMRSLCTSFDDPRSNDMSTMRFLGTDTMTLTSDLENLQAFSFDYSD
jgi:hypothetical protein